jgi:hypothetical protein
MKLKSSCVAKEKPEWRGNPQSKKITMYTSNKELIQRIYKELKKLMVKKQIALLKTWQ